MVDAAQTVFDQRPEPFNGVCMLVANDINLLRVMNATVIVTKRIKPTIRCVLIGVNDGARQYSFLHEWLKRAGEDVGDHSGNDMALTINRSGYDGFVFTGRAAFLPASAITANISFVNFNAPAQWFVILFEHLANLFEHAPRGFVSNSGFAFKLLRRDSATSRGHEIDRVKPRTQRRAGLVVDRVRGRVNMVAAMLARVRLARSHPVMLCHLAARVAEDAVGVQIILEPLKAGIIRWELALEILERVASHFRALNFGLSWHRVCPLSTYKEGNTSRTYCQGIITNVYSISASDMIWLCRSRI